MKTLKTTVIVVLTVLALSVAGLAGAALAQTPTPTAQAPGAAPFAGGWGHRGGPQMEKAGPLHDLMQAELAKALGLTTDELAARIEAGETPYQIAESQGKTAAEIVELFQAAREAAVKQAVADGVITRAQADWMLAHEGRQGKFGGFGLRGPAKEGPLHDLMQAELAKALGLTTDELAARIEAGETPYQIAESQGKTADEISALFQTAREAALKQAVTDGVITQAQADWMLAHPGGPCQGGFGPGRGPRSGNPGGFGPGRQTPGGVSPNENTPAVPFGLQG